MNRTVKSLDASRNNFGALGAAHIAGRGGGYRSLVKIVCYLTGQRGWQPLFTRRFTTDRLA
jgi:hypothetical protein